MASITKVHVNGALENKRYVAGAMKGTQDFMTATANPILEQLLADIARVRPANAKRFAIRELSGKSKPADDAEEAAPAVVAKYFASQVDPWMKGLVRSLMTKQPTDVKAFIVDYLQ